MQTKPNPAVTTASLRDSAEARLRQLRRNQKSKAAATKSDAEAQRLLHELQVHQVELEMQNIELQDSRDRMEMLLEKYTDLYDFAPAGYFTLATSGTIRKANLTGASLVGIERSRLVGQTFARLIAPKFRSPFNIFLKQCFAGEGEPCIDAELLSKGEPLRTIRIRGQRSPGGLDCRIVVVDITELKREEDKVRVSEIRYRRLFEAAHDGILLLDPGTRKITNANPCMTKLLGRANVELVGKELFEVGLFQDEAASRELFERLRRQHEVRYEAMPLESQHGAHREVEVTTSLYQENDHAVIQCNIRDITERKQAEKTQHRVEVLGGANLKLRREIIRRQAVEASLKKSEQHQSRLLARSHAMQEQLRHLSRQVLRVQEEERKRISRELHDVIAQTLTGINIHLATLKQAAGLKDKTFNRNIAQTQRLVEQSVNTVHRFALELRPPVLDDLGLIAALHSFMKNFTEETGVRAYLTAFAAVEQFDTDRRTALFRVAQEALTNVARHAHASRVDVTIQKLADGIGMKIQDDGKSFHVEQELNTSGRNRLGLLGMRERLEMIGGTFSVESEPGKGTTIVAWIPSGNTRRGAC